MKNNSVSDFVASTMDALLGSEEYKTLFHKGFVSNASDESAEKSTEDKSHAEDFTLDNNDAADDDDNNEVSDNNDMKGESCSAEEKVSTALDVAIDSLLTASAALDSVGLESSSSLSLKLASFVVEAK